MTFTMERRLQGTSSQKKHVLIFRHCVRSTDTEVNIYNATNTSGPVPLRDFWPRLVQPEVNTPNWNVPTNWCTENGMKQMSAAGTHIYDTFLRSGSTYSLKFRFLSDTSQRDADTALALQEGLALAALADNSNGTLSESKLHMTEYVPHLFHPFDSTTMSSSPLCSLQVTSTQWQQEVQNRLNTIASPPLSLIDTLELLQLGNVNYPNSVRNSNHTPTVTMDANNEPKLSGLINVIKLVVQTLFYSRASGIVPMVFLHRITNAQIYQLLPWVYYTRSILNVGTTESASRGAVLVRTMVDALQFDTVDRTDLGDTVTVLVGHDTDLDAIATAMNVAWEFRAPYSTDKNSLDWYSTPPGSAIFITHEQESSNREGGVVTLSYFYPVFQLRNSSGESGIVMNENATILTWRQFQQHINTTLQRYTGAMDCYNSATKYIAANISADGGDRGDRNPPTMPSTQPPYPTDIPPQDLENASNNSTSSIDAISWSSFGSGFGTGVAVVIVLLFASWFYRCRRQQRLRSQYSETSSALRLHEYDAVGGRRRKVDLV